MTLYNMICHDIYEISHIFQWIPLNQLVAPRGAYLDTYKEMWMLGILCKNHHFSIIFPVKLWVFSMN